MEIKRIKLRLLIYLISAHLTTGVIAQVSGAYVNNLPDFLPPAPEAAAILKADQLAVGFTTGSPNISIPIASLPCGGYSLPLSLNYSSTGIKVDEVASIVGMGWTLTYGGVISRTVFDRPDEFRDTSNCNLNPVNPDSHDQALLDFLEDAPDKQSDIFTFSFPQGSGKFILDINGEPKQLTNQNFKIETIDSNFLNGFVIISDDGTSYFFEDAEVVTNREPIGENCGKTYNGGTIKTSWFLTRIVLPTTHKWIKFEYTTSDVGYEASISQTISRTTYSKFNTCTGSDVCAVGTINFSTCINLQITTSKFISKITNSLGDHILFSYSNRTDLSGGERLASIDVFNRSNVRVRHVNFNTTYYSAATASNSGYYYDYSAAGKRLFLSSVTIQGNEMLTSNSAMIYSFSYVDPTLPARLSYAQDYYGYYNGKTTNGCLIPKLPSGDENYATFSNGTGTGSIQFGDRSIDTSYAKKGLLNKIIYPTGGYDVIDYIANRKIGGVLTGGNSVSKISSYTQAGQKIHERSFLYQFMSTGESSALVLTNDLTFSTSKKTYQSYCNTVPDATDPTCSYAVVTSNASNPISVFSGQHVYFQSVLEREAGADGFNGMTEHVYSYFAGGNLGPRHRMGNYVLNAPFEVVPDVLLGETYTNVYKADGSSSTLIKSTKRSFRIDSLKSFFSYVVNNNSDGLGDVHSPPVETDFLPFDMEQVYINSYALRNDSTIEVNYDANGSILRDTTLMAFANFSYSYPTAVTSRNSDGTERRIERKYPQDFPGCAFMVNRNIVNPVIEEKTYAGASLLATKVQSYKDWFNDQRVIVPRQVSLVLKNSPDSQSVVFHSYDTLGNVQTLSKQNDINISYIWGYGSDVVIAKVEGAFEQQVAYTSFESDGMGNWSGGSTQQVVTDSRSATGKRYYACSGSLSKSGLDPGTVYLVSYWSKSNSLTVSGSISGWPKTYGQVMVNGQSWTLYLHKVTGVNTLTITGAGDIDELRLYPWGARMTTFTYEPLVGITSETDAGDHITYYEYDAMGRLILIRDANKNVLKKFCYNYKGQPEVCGVYYNTSTSQSFSRNDCDTGYVGTSVTYTVPAGIYAGASQEEADARAQADIDANGQSFANRTGSCVLACTSSNCTGDANKCIGGVCQTGAKVYTSSVQVHGSLWECTYHYEWSDGSWSQDYVEYSSTRCFNIINDF